MAAPIPPTPPSSARVVGRATVLGAVFGAACGATLWVGGCVTSGAPAGIPLGLIAGTVGGVIGVPVGLASTGPLLAVSRGRAAVGRPAAAVAGAFLPGLIAVVLAALALGGGPTEPASVAIWCAIVAMAVIAGAAAGPVALAPVVSARRSGAAAAVGTASPGSSPAPGR